MPLRKNPEQDLIPKGVNIAQLQKGLGCCLEVLTIEVPKRKRVNLPPVTGPKLMNVILTQMMTKYSAPGASEVLECIEDTLITFCKAVLEQPDPTRTLESIVEVYGRENSPAMLSTSPPTLSKYLDRCSIHHGQTLLTNQVHRIQGLLRKKGLWPGKVHLSLDPTDEPYHGKYHNQYTNWGLVGQQNTYRRVFKGLGIYLNPPQLLATYVPVPIKTQDPARREVPAWILEARRVITDLHAVHTAVPLITYDRGFYSAFAMALAHVGEIVPELPLEENPRLFCPKKFWEDVVAYKWRFLLDPEAPVVKEEPMQLTYYDERLLGTHVTVFPRNEKGDHRLVPTWTVAGFDVYSEKKKPKSLDWARREASRVNEGIRAAIEAKRAAEEEFRRYTREVLGVERKMPAYRGPGRTKFKFSGERKRYRACKLAHARLQRWREKKTALCKRLALFTASKRRGERVTGDDPVFTSLVRQYRERWGIENGFKSVKADFHVRTNSRKTTARHIRFILGALFFNAWHYRRLTRVARHVKKKRSRWKPFDRSSPPLRKKFERDHGPTLSARGFLLEELGESLHFSIQAMIIQVTSV